MCNLKKHRSQRFYSSNPKHVRNITLIEAGRSKGDSCTHTRVPWYTGTQCVTPSPESMTIPVVRPDEYLNERKSTDTRSNPQRSSKMPRKRLHEESDSGYYNQQTGAPVAPRRNSHHTREYMTIRSSSWIMSNENLELVTKRRSHGIRKHGIQF